jgi:hypothetical protein
MNDPNRGNYIEGPPLSPRAAPATGPWDGAFRDEIQCPHCDAIDYEHTDYPSALQKDGDEVEACCAFCDKPMRVALCASYTYATAPLAAPASPPPEPAPEAFVPCALCGKPVDGVLESTMPVLCGCDEEPPPEPAEERCPDCGETPAEAAARWARIELSPNYDPEGAPTPCDHAALPAPALPRPEEPVLGNLTGSATAGDDPRSLLIEPAASAPPPRPEESALREALLAAIRLALGTMQKPMERMTRVCAMGLIEPACDHPSLRALQSAMTTLQDAHDAALSAPPPGEAVRLLTAMEEEARRGFIYGHARTGADWREALTRYEKALAALRAALREDEKGAKP